MADRYTKQHAIGAFLRLARALDAPHREDAKGSAGEADGVLWLDYEPMYGGYVVQQAQHFPDGGRGVGHPFGHTRRSAREFYQAVALALDTLAFKERIDRDLP